MVRTWGTVITMVNNDRPARRRLMNSCAGKVCQWEGVGLGGIDASFGGIQNPVKPEYSPSIGGRPSIRFTRTLMLRADQPLLRGEPAPSRRAARLPRTGLQQRAAWQDH